jgi:hypothetical protein
MNSSNVWTLVLDTIEGLGASMIVVLALLIGFCVLLGMVKLRPSGRSTRVVRSLDEALGRPEAYLPPDAPRGAVDQLRTPELLEAAARKSG